LWLDFGKTQDVSVASGSETAGMLFKHKGVNVVEVMGYAYYHE